MPRKIKSGSSVQKYVLDDFGEKIANENLQSIWIGSQRIGARPIEIVRTVWFHAPASRSEIRRALNDPVWFNDAFKTALKFNLIRGTNKRSKLWKAVPDFGPGYSWRQGRINKRLKSIR